MKKLLLALFVLITALGYASDSTYVTNNSTKRYFKIIPLPVLGTSPSTGFLFGGAFGAYWNMGDAATTSLSSALGNVFYTLKNQVLCTTKATTYFNNDKWYLLTDLRYFITSQPTYGLGTGPQSAKPVGTGFDGFTDNPYQPIPDEQLMYFDYFRVHNTLMKRYGQTRFFWGLGYHFDYHFNIKDHLLNLVDSPKVITSHYAYSVYYGAYIPPQKYITSGVSLNLLFDSRDNGVNPYTGHYAYANIRINPRFLGSTHTSSLLWLESREYLHLNKARPRHMIALWNYGWFVTSGKAPYLDLPAVGWDQYGRSGRAYTQGRFRGEQLIYNEIEYRVPLLPKSDLLGAVVFVNGTTACNKAAKIRLFEYYDIGYGAGLRVMVSKKNKANLNLDYAFGKYGAQGFYVGLNEVF